MTDPTDDVREDPAEPVEDPDAAVVVDPTDGWPAMTPRTCANGTPHAGCSWAPQPCAGCRAYSEELGRQFREAVARGAYDDRGYEPGDRQFRQDSLF